MQKWEYRLLWQTYDGTYSEGHFEPKKPLFVLKVVNYGTLSTQGFQWNVVLDQELARRMKRRYPQAN